MLAVNLLQIQSGGPLFEGSKCVPRGIESPTKFSMKTHPSTKRTPSTMDGQCSFIWWRDVRNRFIAGGKKFCPEVCPTTDFRLQTNRLACRHRVRSLVPSWQASSHECLNIAAAEESHKL